MSKRINFTAIALIAFTFFSCKKEMPIQELPDSALAITPLKEINACSSPPQFLGIRTVGGTGHDNGRDIFLLKSGGTILTGDFVGTVDFDPGEAEVKLTAQGYGSRFFQQYSGNGKFLNVSAEKLNWPLEDGNQLLGADENGYIYQVVAEDGGSTPEALFECAANAMNFGLQKKDPSGNILWKKYFYNKLPVWCKFPSPVSATNNQGTTVISYLGSWSKFNAAGEEVNVKLPNIGITSAKFWIDDKGYIYISRYNRIEKYDDNTGKLLATVNINVRDIAFDDASNIYTVGVFSGTRDFNPWAGTFEMTATVDNAIYIQKFGPSANFIWAKQLGAGSPLDIKVDAKDNRILIAGSFTGTQAYNTVYGNVSITSKGGTDAFIMALLQCK